MKVLYDSQAFDMQTHGGVSRCFVELYKHLPQDVEAKISVVETDNVYLNNMGIPSAGTCYRNFLTKRDSKLKHVLYKLCYNTRYGNIKHWDKNVRLNQLESLRQIKAADYDILHPTFFVPYYLGHTSKPTVLTVHDMITELYPQHYPPTDNQVVWKKMVIPRADHIVAVSQQTKIDLMRLFNVPEEKISVVYHGVDEAPYVPTPNYNKEFEYILYVGDRNLYKNFISFVDAVEPVLKRHKELKVICTGKPFTTEEQQRLTEKGIAERFIQRFIQSDQEFMDLYHNAITFVYPSEYEGFGIPILEAYKADCPVMLNNASCFPEIAGDAAVYFNMKNGKSDFEEQFETLYHLNANEREQLLQKQRERMLLYSWSKSAELLADVYRRLC